jgi:hypothetical protein
MFEQLSNDSNNGLQSLVDTNVCDSQSQPANSRTCPVDVNCPEEYHWRNSEWSTCPTDTACTSGGLRSGAQQERSVICVNAKTLVEVADKLCESIPKPDTSRSCAVASQLLLSGETGSEDKESCTDYQWHVVNEGTTKEYGACSQACGGGTQNRRVLCIDASFADGRFSDERSALEMEVAAMDLDTQLQPMAELYNERLRVVDDDLCEALHGQAPERSRLCTDNVCLNDGECQVGVCMCPPGFKGPACETFPLSQFDIFVSLGTELENEDVEAENTGVLPGDPLYVTWSASRAAAYGSVDVYLQRPNTALPIPLSNFAGIAASDGAALVHVPLDVGPPGDNYAVLVVVNRTLWQMTKPFTLLEGCDLMDCGTHGRCQRSESGAAVCKCRDGYSGESCAITPCAKVGCLTSRVGVNECLVSSDADVTCVCNQVREHVFDCLESNICKQNKILIRIRVVNLFCCTELSYAPRNQSSWSY